MRDTAVIAIRDQLGAEIAEAIHSLEERRVDTAVRLGNGEMTATMLASGGRGHYTVDRLLNYCEPLGLEPKMTVTGLNEGEPEPRVNRRRAHVEPDFTPSGVLRKQLIHAIAHQIATSGISRDELAEQTGIPSTTLSTLRSEDIRRFRVDKLIELAAKLGLDVELTVHPA
ncbi:helix-turn-helix domain-containing protein [Nocardia vinacea]|uniref:Helix-turn-helix domain-containing protein n=1 Tax=Nocardia vinacea TaxID=96468 RepID=A0ABZ1YM05_9NOCA|nr:XRE family transcriptional regulator [Nocardia vinacea]